MLTYIAGAGAMGCRFGYQLHKASNKVILLDKWPEHVKAIKENGLTVTGDIKDNVKIEIMEPNKATIKGDFIILFTKAMQLESMLKDIKKIIGADTKMLCLLNGLGHEDIIAKYVKKENIIMGVTVWTSSLDGPGVVHLIGTGAVNMQFIESKNKAAAAPMLEMMNNAGLNVTYDDNVLPSIWRKACVNGTMNSTCALEDCTIAQFFGNKNGLNIVKKIIHEFVEVGKAQGITLNEQEIYNYVIKISVEAGAHYPSMHQDLCKNHRPTEIDYINGAITRKGAKLGIDAPYCQLITDLIHAKEHILGIN